MKAKAYWSTIGVILLSVATFGCERNTSAREEGREAAAEAKEEGREAANKTGEATGDAGSAVHGAKQTFDVKAALTADPNIDASHIDVDTNHDTDTVTLRGWVPTAEHKAAAERIAREKAEGYTVVNNLTVGAPR